MQDCFGIFLVDVGVGDVFVVGQWFIVFEVLVVFYQMVFNYYVYNGVFVVGDLLVYVGVYFYLFFELFVGVGMVEVDYYLGWKICFCQIDFYFCYVFCVVVRFFVVV